MGKAPELISENGLGQSKLKPTSGKTPVGRTPKAPKRVSLNPRQQANLNVNRVLNPQYAQAAAEAARQNQAIQAYTTAAMQQLGLLAPQIQSDYQHAADTQSGLVNAAAESLKAANPNADLQGLLSSIGAPAAQGQQLQQQLGNVFTGGAGVSQYTNALPISALQSQGLAATELARLQPGNLALSGRQSLLSALKQQGDTRAQIAAQYPKLFQDQLDTFSSNSMKRQQLAMEAQAAGLKVQKQGFDQNLAVSKLRQQQNQFIAKQAAKADSYTKPNNSLSRTKGYVVDGNGNPILVNGKRQILPGFSVNAQGRVIKTPKAAKAGKTSQAAAFPNLTKTQVLTLRARMAKSRNGVPANPKTGDPAYPPISYREAIARSIAQGFSRADATLMANRFYPPGVAGRPSKAVKAQNARSKKGRATMGPPNPNG